MATAAYEVTRVKASANALAGSILVRSRVAAATFVTFGFRPQCQSSTVDKAGHTL
jgi:hypothetical protein